VVGKLLREGFIEEVPARGVLPMWRSDNSHEAMALRITKVGLAAIGIEADVAGTAEAAPETPDAGDPARKGAVRRVAASRKKSKGKTPKWSPKPSPRDSNQSRAHFGSGSLHKNHLHRSGATFLRLALPMRGRNDVMAGFRGGLPRNSIGWRRMCYVLALAICRNLPQRRFPEPAPFWYANGTEPSTT
jgi:hypothetical protein